MNTSNPAADPNSRLWWENYHREHWEKNNGRSQTRYFMQRLVGNLPAEETSYLVSKGATVLDWGCAFGDGVEDLAKSFPKCRVSGLDFAQRAIEEARRAFPQREFLHSEDGEIPGRFDVIVTSNCLEHFDDPLAVARRHARSCRDFYVVLVPYREQPLCEYHRSRFAEDSFPEQLEGFSRVSSTVIDVDPAFWDGQQLLVVYASQSYLKTRTSRVEEQQKWDSLYASLPLQEVDDYVKQFGDDLAQHVSELLPDGGRVLEAGCGAGWQTVALARNEKFRCTLMDFSSEALNYAQRCFARENIEATFVYGDVFAPGEPEYDLVFNAGVLEHYAFEEQVAFLRGMASRSRKYVLALVPNRFCYWYWLWRVQMSSQGKWPYGKEVPVADLSAVFEAAGLHFVGQWFGASQWSESFIDSLPGLDDDLRKRILAVHRSEIIPAKEKGYLVAALGCKGEVREVPSCWNISGERENFAVAEMAAALADATAATVAAEFRCRQLQDQLSAREAQWVAQTSMQDRARAELNQQIAEQERVQAELSQRIAEKEAEKEQAQVALEQELHKRANEVLELRDYLAALNASRSWRLMRKLQRVRLWLAPRGSFREYLGSMVLRAARVVRRGPRAMLYSAGREIEALQKQLESAEQLLRAEQQPRRSAEAEREALRSRLDVETKSFKAGIEALQAESERKLDHARQQINDLSYRLRQTEHSLGYRCLQRLKAFRQRCLWLSATHELRPILSSVIEAFLGWFWRLVLGRRMGAILDARNQDPYFYHHTLRVFTLNPEPWHARHYLTVDTRQPAPWRVKVSLIATVYNEASNIRQWIQDVGRQSRLPDEMIIVDGGSNDGTPEIVAQEGSNLPFPLKVVVEPGCNIARGRNIAIRHATNEFIASADAGCSLSPQWLEHLIAPFEHDETVDAVIGWFEIDPDAPDWTKANTWLFLPALQTTDVKNLLPSSRSFALRRALGLRIGGYPEHLTRWGEDTLFALNLTGIGAKWAFAPEAVAYWQGPENWSQLLKLCYHYALGDGEARIYLATHGANARAVLTMTLLVAMMLVFAVTGVAYKPLLWAAAAAAATGLLYFCRVGVTKWALAHQPMWGSSYQGPLKRILNCWLTAAGSTAGVLKGLWRSRGVVMRRVLDVDAETVVFLPSHEWFWMKQRPTQLAEAFARRGLQVVFCPNNCIERTHGGLLKVDDRIILCNDLGCIDYLKRPIIYSAAAHHFTSRRRLLHRHSRIIFDMIDEKTVSGSTEEDVRAALRMADVTCVTARKLEEYVRRFGGKDPLMVPNAVHYEDWRPRGRPAPPDLASIIHDGQTVIGYVGALSYWFDFALVAAAAEMRPDWHFVLIGPVLVPQAQDALDSLPRNVHHLGTKHYSELAAYVENFSVATIPFLITEVTLCTNPVKLFEYAAAEVPIVTTDLPECRAFEVVLIAHSPEEFVAHLDRAVAQKQDPQIRRSLRELALANTWDQRVDAILAHLEPMPQREPQAPGPARSVPPQIEIMTHVPPSEKWREQAAALNRQLYDQTAQIDPELLETVTDQVERFGRVLNYTKEYRRAWRSHRYRLAATLTALKPLLRTGAPVLELGGLSVVTLILKDHFPTLHWRNADWDIRLPWPCEADSMEAVVAMEVLEHLNDLPDGLNDTFNQSGLRACLAEAHRVLRPGGVLFATTPNGSSIVCLASILYGNVGMFYPLHIREYCRHELEDLATQAGFHVEQMETFHCLTIDSGVDYTALFQLLLRNGHRLQDRGDDWFMVLRKPGSGVLGKT